MCRSRGARRRGRAFARRAGSVVLIVSASGRSGSLAQHECPDRYWPSRPSACCSSPAVPAWRNRDRADGDRELLPRGRRERRVDQRRRHRRSRLGKEALYHEFGLECYAGTRITVRGETYGTVFFTNTAPREAFTEAEQAFLDLLGQCVGYEIERRQHKADLEETIEQLEQSND
ncbi:GAF domain-containing protein [Halolamina salifodinae]|uniref:GAF domain-containing protein n=1 Tax=Halolamina salifodinae TaxID=1202767 RepID=UPI0031F30540